MADATQTEEGRAGAETLLRGPDAGAGVGPLDGIRVIEVANFISGPFATMMLADLGADVIKVEPPRGDPFRRFGRPSTPMAPVFANANHNKRSVTIDLKSEAGHEEFRDLLRTADIMVCNWRPAVAQRLGLPDDLLAADNPTLVRVYVSGYGPTGPLADQPTFDSIIQGRLGLTEAQGDGTRPVVATSYVVDKVASSTVCQAALAALVGRARTGHGERIDVAMLDAAAYHNYPDVMTNRTFIDHAPAQARNRHAAAVRAIAAEDGWLVVTPVTAEQIRRAAVAVDEPEIADELLALTDAVRITELLNDRLEVRTRSRPLSWALEQFAKHDVPAAPCLSIDDHLLDAQVVHNELYTVTEWPGFGQVRTVRYPAVFSTWGKLGARTKAPAPGEHTDEVRTETAARLKASDERQG